MGRRNMKGINNPMYGKHHSEEAKQKVSAANSGINHGRYGTHLSSEAKQHLSEIRQGENNPAWKGDSVGYSALHKYIKKRFPKPSRCDVCFKETTNLDLSNISQEYRRDLSDWLWMCRPCHIKSDGRIRNLRNNEHVDGFDVKSIAVQGSEKYGNKTRRIVRD